MDSRDAFDLVLPSIPGYGFSSKPPSTGWDYEHMGRAWAELMKRLGYTRYVAQGGDLGSFITGTMAVQAPPGLLSIHLTLPATVPLDVAAALGGGEPPASLSVKEREALEQIMKYAKKDAAYNIMMSTRPQTIGYALTDSPVGLAAWMLGHPGFAEWTFGANPNESPTRDEVLDDITLYWLTNTGTSAARAYWENNRAVPPLLAVGMKTDQIAIPVGITVFPGEVYRAPETWARRAYPNLSYFHEVDKGGHFGSWEQPLLFAEEMRSAFRPLRASS